MADRDEMISQFTTLTNVDVDRARFFLESSAWQIEVALASFYENNEDEDIQEIRGPTDEPEIVEEIQHQPASEEAKPPSDQAKKPRSTAPPSRFGTLASLQDSEESDEDEGQAFYAGGSEHSGQQILGPGKKKKDFVAEMFKSVREHGAEVVDPRQASSSKKSHAFSGTGYRLGQTTEESQVVASTSGPPDNSPVQVTLRMYRTGFTVDNGPLRDYKNPDNLAFLTSVNKGEIPAELTALARGRELNLEMEDHRMEEFLPPKQKTHAFTGQGHLLGSPAPATVTSLPTSQDNSAESEDNARRALATDSTQPTTTVQVRLHDGSRLVVTLNHTHTVGDLRSYVATARPQLQNQMFHLRTTFPSAELKDESKTLAEAGLLNAAVLLRLG